MTTSCSNDELETAQSGNEAQVTFALDLKSGIGTRTRAISDGQSADKLVYAVFDKDGNRITTINKVEKSDVSFPTKETLTLAKGQTYKVAFWAQDGDCSAYTVDDDMNVKVSYESGKNNDESRDAFFKTVEFTVSGSAAIDVELKRPFAQVNVGVTQDDWTAAVASGITVKTSSVKIKKAATKIDLVTGAVSEPVDVTYDLADIPAENLSVDADGDGEKENYKWLSMSYILVDDESETAEGVQGAAKATLEGLEFTFKPESGEDIVLKDGLTSVPVQRNWRTNILGQILTGNIDLNISITPDYDDEHIYPDGGVQDLQMAAANGGVVTLTEDVTLPEQIKVAAGKHMEIDLNGHTINNTTDLYQNADGIDIWSLFSVDGGSLVIKNGKVVAKKDDCYAVDVQHGGKVTIESGTFVGNIHAVYVYEGTAEIKGGTFEIQQEFSTQRDPFGFVINCYDASYKAGKANVIITGGTFVKFNPADCIAEGDHTNFLAEGYSSVKSGNDPATYTVVKNATANDIPKAGVIAVTTPVDLNNYYLSFNKASSLLVAEGAELNADDTKPQAIITTKGESTIYGSGTIQGPKYSNGTNNSGAVWMGGGILTVDGVSVKNGGQNPAETVNATFYMVKGTLNINDGYFHASNDAAGNPNPVVFLRGNSMGICTLNIYGGVFESESTGENNYLINVQDGLSANHNKVNVYGGTFVGFNPADGDKGVSGLTTFVADGYESVAMTYNGKSAWKVQKKGE